MDRPNITYIEGINAGDRRAFESLYQKYWERLYLFARKISGSNSVAADAVQEVFVSLWEKKGRLQIIQVDGYLFQSVKYQLYKAIKEQQFEIHPLEHAFEGYLQDSVDKDEVQGPSEQELLDLIAELPPKRREIVYLSKFQNLSHTEIASELGVSVQTVKNQLGLALSTLRTAVRNIPLKLF